MNKKDTKIKCKKSVKIIIGVIVSCAILLCIFIVGNKISNNKKIDAKIVEIEKEIEELEEKKSNESSMFEQGLIEQDIMELESEISSLEFDRESVHEYFFIIPIFMVALVSSVFVYNIGNRDLIIAQQKQAQKERFEMFGKAMANVAKEFNPEYKAFTCPNCGANIDGDDIEVCDYCGTKLVKVGKFH